MNTVVNFEIAKLLKEKRFESESKAFYDGSGELFYYNYSNNVMQRFRYSAPTIAEVVIWIYEKHGIWISVDWMTRIKPFNSGFISHLRGINKKLNSDNFIVINNAKNPGYEVFNSPTEAYEAAIEYCLNNLI